MSSDWQIFVEAALQRPADDPHVRLLRERLSQGCSIVRVNVIQTAREPEYLIVLSCNQQLTETRVPHSESFTRFCLDAGVRMETLAEEALRFAIVARDRLLPIEQRTGRDYLSAILCEQISSLGAPRSVEKLADRPCYPPADSPTRWETTQAFLDALRELARDLSGALRYEPAQAADILDQALADLINERFHITDRERLFPPGWRR